jgi:hypothetical protein
MRVPELGCPRNNQIFVSVQTNRNSICFGCFSICFAKPKNFFLGLFRFVSVFRTSIKTTETNRIFTKQTEKISKKRFLLGSPRNRDFFSRFEEPKQNETQSVSVVFRFAFSRNKKKISVCFDVLDQYRNNRNKQKL